MSVLLLGDFCSSVLLEQSKWSSGCYGSYTWFVSLFCVENYGTEEASCLAFSWVFLNEILMKIGWGWSYGTARKTNDYATKIHFMCLESTLLVSSGCYFSIIIQKNADSCSVSIKSQLLNEVFIWNYSVFRGSPF